MHLFNFATPESTVLLFAVFAITSLALTIWSVVEIASKPFRKENDKVIWLIIVLLLGLIGPLIYLTQRKKLLANPAGGLGLDNREYLPPLDEHPTSRQPSRQAQARYEDEDYV